MPYGTGRATVEDEEDRAAREFHEELSGPPPGEAPLVQQFLGWCYILTGVALAIVTMREVAASGSLDALAVRNGLAVAAYVAVGVAVDAGKEWALWPAIALSGVTVYLMAAPGLQGDLVSAAGAVVHAVLLVAVPLVWLSRQPGEPA